MAKRRINMHCVIEELLAVVWSVRFNRIIRAFKSVDFDLDVVQVFCLVQGNPRYELILAGQNEEIEDLLVQRQIRGRSGASHDTSVDKRGVSRAIYPWYHDRERLARTAKQDK